MRHCRLNLPNRCYHLISRGPARQGLCGWAGDPQIHPAGRREGRQRPRSQAYAASSVGAEVAGISAHDAWYHEPGVLHEGVSPSADGDGVDCAQRPRASKLAAAEIRLDEGRQAANRKGRAAMTRKTYCGNLLWQSSLTILCPTPWPGASGTARAPWAVSPPTTPFTRKSTALSATSGRLSTTTATRRPSRRLHLWQLEPSKIKFYGTTYAMSLAAHSHSLLDGEAGHVVSCVWLWARGRKRGGWSMELQRKGLENPWCQRNC